MCDKIDVLGLCLNGEIVDKFFLLRAEFVVLLLGILKIWSVSLSSVVSNILVSELIELVVYKNAP